MFKEDGPIYKFMWLVADMIMVEVLWFIFSLPIVTIGASTAAALHVNMRLLRHEETYIFKNFFAAFKRDFKQATKLWLVLAVLSYMVVMNVRYLLKLINPTLPHIVILALGILFMLMCFIYAFPMVTRYESTTRQTMMNSMAFSIRWPGKWLFSLLQLGLLVFAYYFCTMLLLFYRLNALIGMLVFLYVIIFPEAFLITLANRGMIVMDKYEKMVGIVREDAVGDDEWHVEDEAEDAGKEDAAE